MNRVQGKTFVTGVMLALVCAFAGASAHAADAVSNSSQAQIPQTDQNYQDQNQAAVDQQNAVAAATASKVPAIAVTTWNNVKITHSNGKMSLTMKVTKAGKYFDVSVVYYNDYTKLTSTHNWNTGTPHIISHRVVDEKGKQTYYQPANYNTNPDAWKKIFNTMHQRLVDASKWTSPSGKSNRNKILTTASQFMKVKNYVVHDYAHA